MRGHRGHEVSIAQPIRDVPANAQLNELAPKNRSEAEDHNLGVALRQNLQAYLKKQRPAARAFFLNVVRDPRVSHLLDESLATARRWQTERHPTDRTEFDRLHLLHSREFARREAHKLRDLVVANQREAKATVQ